MRNNVDFEEFKEIILEILEMDEKDIFDFLYINDSDFYNINKIDKLYVLNKGVKGNYFYNFQDNLHTKDCFEVKIEKSLSVEQLKILLKNNNILYSNIYVLDNVLSEDLNFLNCDCKYDLSQDINYFHSDTPAYEGIIKKLFNSIYSEKYIYKLSSEDNLREDVKKFFNKSYFHEVEFIDDNDMPKSSSTIFAHKHWFYYDRGYGEEEAISDYLHKISKINNINPKKITSNLSKFHEQLKKQTFLNYLMNKEEHLLINFMDIVDVFPGTQLLKDIIKTKPITNHDKNCIKNKICQFPEIFTQDNFYKNSDFIFKVIGIDNIIGDQEEQSYMAHGLINYRKATFINFKDEVSPFSHFMQKIYKEYPEKIKDDEFYFLAFMADLVVNNYKKHKNDWINSLNDFDRIFNINNLNKEKLEILLYFSQKENFYDFINGMSGNEVSAFKVQQHLQEKIILKEKELLQESFSNNKLNTKIKNRI